jgi:hypothetical protein
LKPIGAAQLKTLPIEAAIEQEAASWRNLLPPEPWGPIVAEKSQQTVEWLRRSLRSGLEPEPAVRVMARKASGGARPVPILRIADRVAYRALVDAVLTAEEPLDRSAEAYRDFARGPISLGFGPGEGAIRQLGDATFTHVVEADIASFYEYIDHAVLQRELEIRSDEYEHIEPLIELLGAIEGRQFGVPQLIESSDRLSEVYISIVHRDLVRRGYKVWRFNDDFRIGCEGYDMALSALEALQESTRRIGLVPNDHKLRTPSFLWYFAATTGMDVSDISQEIDPDDVEVIVQEYPDLEPDEAEELAEADLGRISLPEGDPQRIDLKRATPSELRDLRRAVGTLGHMGNEAAIEVSSSLIVFAPSLTPTVARYLVRLAVDYSSAVAEVLERLYSQPLSEWQGAWVAYVSIEAEHQSGAAIRWAREWRSRAPGRLVAAECSRLLAGAREIAFDELDSALRTEPEPLHPWYALAMRRLAEADGEVGGRVRATADSDALYGLLLEE